MTKKTGNKGGKKETIKPPAKKETKAASPLLKKGNSAGGRVMFDASVAKRQGVTSKPPKKR